MQYPVHSLMSLAFAAVCACASSGVSAAAWPAKPVRVIVPAAAGSPPDIIARVISDKLAVAWHQPVIVENKPGASGIIGMMALRQAPDDGQTFILAQAAVIAITPHLFRNPRFDVDADLASIAMVGMSPMIMVANTGFGPKSLDEFMAYARAAKEPVNLAVTGQYSAAYLTAEALRRSGRLNVNIVPFSSSSSAVTAVVNGDAQMMIDGVPSLDAMIKAKRLRPLAVTSRYAIASAPGVPTLADTAPEADLSGWFVLFGRKGTARTVIEKMHRDVSATLQDGAVIGRMAELGVFPRAMSPAQLDRFLATERARWSTVVKAAAIEPQ